MYVLQLCAAVTAHAPMLTLTDAS